MAICCYHFNIGTGTAPHKIWSQNFCKETSECFFQKFRNETTSITVDLATVSLQDHRNELGNMDANVKDTDCEWIRVQYKAGNKNRGATLPVKEKGWISQ